MPVTVQCHYCGADLEISTRRYNYGIKCGGHFYCPGHHRLSKIKRVACTCAHCGKHIEKEPSQLARSKSGRVFCSRSCATSFHNHIYRTGANHPNYIDGITRYMVKAFRVYQPKCVMCGLDEPCCLEVHHIDENRKNNKIDNLIILCANCHRRIHRGGFQLTPEILQNREVVQSG